MLWWGNKHYQQSKTIHEFTTEKTHYEIPNTNTMKHEGNTYAGFIVRVCFDKQESYDNESDKDSQKYKFSIV